MSAFQIYQHYDVMMSVDDVMMKKLIFTKNIFSHLIVFTNGLYICFMTHEYYLFTCTFLKVKVKGQGHQKVKHENQQNPYFFSNFI